MATRFIEGASSSDISGELTRLKGDTTSNHLPILYDFTNGVLKIYDRVAGAVKQLATLTGTETLTNKTFTSPTITTPTISGSTLTTPAGVVVAQETLFTQVAGNKTHTASFSIPAGATILDIIITNTAVWTSDTSATLIAGISGGDTDCFFTGLDLKTIPAAGKSINFAWPGGAQGASVPAIDVGGEGGVAASSATQLGATNGFLYNATAKTVDITVADVNVSGTAGRTRATVLYSLPPTVIAPLVS